MSGKLIDALPAILFSVGSALFLIGNLVLVWRALK